MLRRLDLLNHAHEDARQKEASFVGREVYESQVKEQQQLARRGQFCAIQSAGQSIGDIESGGRVGRVWP
jgi:hypothetical protein